MTTAVGPTLSPHPPRREATHGYRFITNHTLTEGGRGTTEGGRGITEGGRGVTPIGVDVVVAVVVAHCFLFTYSSFIDSAWGKEPSMEHRWGSAQWGRIKRLDWMGGSVRGAEPSDKE